ncbi:deleted in malignant brain tumors 1 protein-like [Mytilus trossulus]|uniref:deleted in malignant brain tumors 1 protein-like n=1 Tax=Mytilus trossulus TaxID=6551 RepID=UPI003004A878
MEGRVELLVNGMWSAVCDDDWDNVEATIVCKTLSTFPFDRRVSGKAFRNSFFGHGTGKIAYSSVKCNGTEIDVMHCTLKEVAIPTCDHSNEAGVSCSFAEQIKLSRPVSTTAEGTVFININGDWNTLCDKDFGTQEAQTVCRELGYWSSNVQFFSNSWFGEGNGTSQDLRPQCMGTETKISFCPLEKSWNEMTCSHADDAGVQCTPTTLDTSNVRLIDGDKPGKGRIEVKYNNHWGSFCWRSHTEGKSFLAKRNGSAILIGSLRCHGQEDNIGLCKAFMDKETCTDEAVGVDCTDCVSVNNSKTGSIKSNNYPQPYEPNTDCLYIIQPPTGIYKIEFLDLQMADSGDYVEVKDKLHGRVMGHYTIFSGVKPIFGNQFYIRYRTNSQDESKGFHLQWSVADKADTVSVNCENSKWGAGVNLTSLRTILPEMSKANEIFINEPQCYGFIYDDLLLFQQLYNECDTNKTISNGYVTYTNRIVYIRNKVVQWEVPIECRKHQSSRIYHDHFSTNKRFVVTEDENEEFKFKTTFYYDWDKRLSEDVPFAFNQTYFYKIQLTDNDSDLTFELETCTLQQHKHGKVTLIKVVLNGQPISSGVTIMTVSKDSKVIGININEDVDSHFTCDVKVTFKSTDK